MNKSRSSGFTLFELLLTLAVIAALAAVAIPNLGLLLSDRRLVRAGDQLRVEMTRLRVDAMREGRAMMMQATLDSGTVRVKPVFSATDATEATDQTGSQSALLSGADQAVATTIQVDSDAEELIELPENVTVTGVNVVSSARAMEVEQASEPSDSDAPRGWSRPIVFYPDGSTSTATITLASESVGQVVVKLRGITGDVTISEVLP